MTRNLLILLLCTAPLSAQVRFTVPDVDGMRWWKGNTHTHTTNSDGDSPPDVVVRWYRDHGYNFLVLSDHNVFTDPTRYDSLQTSSFILIPGEELTSSFESKPVHVNGLNIPHVLEARKGPSLLETIQRNVDAVRLVEGVPHINHPNYRWAFGHEILLQVKNDRLLEIYNGHPEVHNLGGGGRPSMEAIWDTLLTAGMRMYGIAVDDAHHFRGEFARNRSNPGRGWIAVRARNLDRRRLMSNLEEGLFYASTGVELDDVAVTPATLTVLIAANGDFRYTTEFVGPGGSVLSRVYGDSAVYTLAGDEAYVRARITDSGGAQAWVQPVWTEKTSEK